MRLRSDGIPPARNPKAGVLPFASFSRPIVIQDWGFFRCLPGIATTCAESVVQNRCSATLRHAERREGRRGICIGGIWPFRWVRARVIWEVPSAGQGA